MILAKDIVTVDSISQSAVLADTTWSAISKGVARIPSTSSDSERLDILNSMVQSLNTLAALNIKYVDGAVSPGVDALNYALMSSRLQVLALSATSYRLLHSGLHADITFDASTVKGPEVVFLVKRPGKSEVVQLKYSDLINANKTIHDSGVLNTPALQEQAQDKEVLASIAVGDDGKVCLYSGFPIIVEKLSPDVVQLSANANLDSLGVFAAYLPSIGALGAKGSAKAKLLNSLSVYNSLSALEKQVDLLSSLVAALIKAVPSTEVPAWYEDYKNQVDANSTEVLQSPEDMIDTISKTKANIRSLQESLLNQSK